VYYASVFNSSRKFESRLPNKTKRLYFLVLLFGGIFLAAQMHCCVDLYFGTTVSHACPVCFTVGAVIVTPSLILVILPVINRLEVFELLAPVLLVGFRSLATRAPPAA
jgi:uncharacterized membrane protein YesL